MNKKPLTKKAKLFCEHSLKIKDRTKCAVKAGYSQNTAKTKAKELLSDPRVKKYIKTLKEDLRRQREKPERRSSPGQPPIYETPEELQEQILAYFEDREAKKAKPTTTGLAYFIGFESRQSLYDTEKRDKFSYTIKRALLYIESFHEENLYKPACTGSIFALKNRGWEDKVHTENKSEHSGEISFTFVEKTERDK